MVRRNNMKKYGFNASRIATILLAFLLATGLAIPAANMNMTGVYAADTTVSSWAELRGAVRVGTHIIRLSQNIVYDGSSIEIPEGSNITITPKTENNAISIYSSVQERYEPMFKVKSGGNLTIDSGVTLSAKKKSTDGSSGQCPDGTTGNPSSYTADEFTGGLNQEETDYQPKGFFIHVEGGGTATLKGTVSDFVTSREKSTTPRYVAPVVANGNNATFNIEGGTIKNNLVGYIVKDDKANQDAQSIKQYVKGAGPNVPRVPNAATQKQNKDTFDRARNKDAQIDEGVPGTGITGTAGAIIYKGGAKGEFTEATITNNRADTGGVMVSGKDTKVTFTSGTISKNVGVQFGGGSTAEQGGIINMDGGNMEYNVAWFGGGAVYATENGVAWLLGLMNGEDGYSPQFDDRLDGEFNMNGGSLNNNTALTRGGAILADSDAVHVNKGALKDNMSRMLGGAVYVMGDHPKYTYTMYLTGLYVHHNTAVSGIDEARQLASAKSGENYTRAELDEINNKLQTKLIAPTACGDVTGDILGDVFPQNSDDMTDGWGTHGTGGGVWLCAYGTTYFNAGATSQVVIAQNYATGAAPLSNQVYPRWVRISSDGEIIREDIAYNTASSVATRTGRTGGNDLHADTGDSGSVIIKNDSGYPGWKDENASTSDEVRYNIPVSEDRVNIVNKGTAQEMPEKNICVEVSGNVSRRGGGLAADGTFMLGMRDDQATAESSINLQKAWNPNVEKKPVSIRINATQGTNTAVVADVPLDGVANAPVTEFDTVEELAPTGNVWNGRVKLPMELNGSNGKIKVFSITLKEEYRPDGDSTGIIDPTTLQGRTKLAAVIRKIKDKYRNPQTGEVDEEKVLAELKKAIIISFNDNLKLTCTEYEMVYDEESGVWTIKMKDGQPVESEEYIFTNSEINLSKAEFEVDSTSYYGEEYNEETKQMEPVEIFQVHLFGINLVLEAQNDNQPITEKYVNKEVHSDIINFDQDFEYDVMAYVPVTAEEFTISDTLVNGLEFADASGKASNNANNVLRAISVKTINNHKPGEEGSVSLIGEPDRNGNILNLKPGGSADIPDGRGGGKNVTFNTRANISNDKRTLTVTIPKGDTLDILKGKWVQLTFGARIQDKYRNIDALKDLESNVDGKINSWEGTNTDKKGSPQSVYAVANGDKAIVAPILSKVGPDPVIWAVEAPSRLFARTAKGDYYATPFKDKSGNTWERLDKDLDDGKDDGYGKPVWINADNRYNGRAPHANNTRRQIGLEDSELTKLKEMPLIQGSAITKAAEGASRYFAEVTDAEGKKHIWATAKGDLSSLTWHEVTNISSDEYKNAVKRLSNDRYTIRMLDLEKDDISLDPDAETGKNWPVISKEDHEGMANQASYSVKFGNNAEAKTYKTNTVTVKPETTELKVEKLWGADGEGSWPDEIKSVTFDIYAIPKNNEIQPVYMKDGKVVGVAGTQPEGSEKLTVTLTKDNYRATVEGLPRLKDYIYLARETKITDANDKSYNLTYSSTKINEGVVSGTTEIGNMEISTSLKFSYAGNGAKFESLRDKENKKVIRGAIADDRLWAMTLDGSYYVTDSGDTKGDKDSVWTLVKVPTSDKDDYETYDRAKELFGVIEELDNDKIEDIDAPIDADVPVVSDKPIVFDIENVVTAFNGALKDVEVTKKWKGAIKDDIPSAEAFKSFLVLKNGNGDDVSETYKDKLEVTARGTTYIAKWSRIPKDNYTIEEKPVPGFDTTFSEDGKIITNSKKPSEEKPEIEKYVNQAVHKDIKLDEVFTYDIIAYVTKDADSVKITDKLHDMLTFEGDSSDVSVVDLGETDNHLVTNNVSGVKVNDKATVAKEGKIIDGTAVSINDQVLTVFITNTLKKSDAVYDPVQIDNIDPSAKGYYEKDGDDYKLTTDSSPESRKTYYEKKETYEEVKDLAPGADISGKGYYEQNGEAYVQTSDTEASENKKYYELVYTYEVITIDAVNPSAEGYYEKDGEAYKPTTDVVADPGKQYYVKSETGYEYDEDEDQPVTALRGHWIKVTFKARINDKTLEEVKKAYQDISASDVDDERDPENVGNAPVISAENHTGIPNDASYTIGVANEAGIEENVHVDRSNVVTVKPKEKKEDEVKPDDEDNNDVKDVEEKGSKKIKSANTGDETPLGYAIFGLLGSAAALELMRRRRMS